MKIEKVHDGRFKMATLWIFFFLAKAMMSCLKWSAITWLNGIFSLPKKEIDCKFDEH